MEDSIFHINKETSEPNNVSYKYYTVFGAHTSQDDNNQPMCESKEKCLAYIKTNNDTEQYYIKVGLHGKIFNPIGLFSEGRQHKFLSKVGKSEYNFTKVNSRVFNLYLNFLRTKNIAWLNNAERELS